MSRVRGKDTKPEVMVRKTAHALGLRYRLHQRGLPGTPDLVFRKYYTVIFVHGCFWHRHPGCSKAGLPKSNVGFWRRKFDRTVARDAQTTAELKVGGWRVEIIWECETRDVDQLRLKLGKMFSAKEQ